MTKKEKQLLLKDLCARLPYGIVVSISYPTLTEKSKKLDIPLVSIDLLDNTCTVGDSYGKTSGLRMFSSKGELLCKPYLRPIESMTEKETYIFRQDILNEVEARCIHSFGCGKYSLAFAEANDWLYEHHFDYRDLIEKGLALEAPEGMYDF